MIDIGHAAFEPKAPRSLGFGIDLVIMESGGRSTDVL